MPNGYALEDILDFRHILKIMPHQVADQSRLVCHLEKITFVGVIFPS